MTWLAIAGSALVTYLVRAFAFRVGLPRELPRWVTRYLDALPAAIIAALAGPAVLVPNGAPTRGPELAAALVVIAVVAWRRNLLAGVLAGVGVVALLRLVLAA
ncbi:MAG TPA: AzlD domain-containing protein [Candidatus Limnocylindria bacterium]|nr:AzlD domain-containing protein [Candidatus Limnocylindria bacterium]